MTRTKSEYPEELIKIFLIHPEQMPAGIILGPMLQAFFLANLSIMLFAA